MVNLLDGLYDVDYVKVEKMEGRMLLVSDFRVFVCFLELILFIVQVGFVFFKDCFDIGCFCVFQYVVVEFIVSDQGVVYEWVENWIVLDSYYLILKLDVCVLIFDL